MAISLFRIADLILTSALAAVLASASARGAVEPVTLEIDLQKRGPDIPPGALGLSYETSILSPNAEGVRYFRPDNEALLGVFRSLGVKHLRVGGNSVDDPKVPLPSLDDVRSLFEFARKAGVKVIYSVRLQNGDPASAAAFAKLIYGEFRDQLDSFAIGNEPGYYKDYAIYSAKWAAIRDAIVREFPDAKFCGPDQNPEPELIAKMVRDFGTAEGRLVQVTEHTYPFGCAYKNPADGLKNVAALIPVDASEARRKMVCEPPYSTYEKILDGMRDAVAGTQLSFRLSETNSYWFSGLEGASDSYAAAIWAADYLNWWISRGAAGINFHTGDRTGGSVNLPCRYAAFVSAGAGYEIRPLAYGMKLFSLMSAGHYVAVKTGDNPREWFSAFATIEGMTLRVMVINRGDLNQELSVSVALKSDRARFKTARRIDLKSASETSHLGTGTPSLGGAPIGANGEWSGRWSDFESDEMRGDALSVNVPAVTAVLIETSLD